MSAEISMIAGLTAETLPSPVAGSSTRPGPQRMPASTKVQNVPEKPSSAATDAPAKDSSHVERAREALMAHNATFSFERDAQDGRIYLHVSDKLTGEEIYCIPKNYLKNSDNHSSPQHEVDVRI